MYISEVLSGLLRQFHVPVRSTFRDIKLRLRPFDFFFAKSFIHNVRSRNKRAEG